MQAKMERRYISQEFRVAKDGSRTIQGYALLFGVRSDDWGGWAEVIAPGAFDDALATDPDVRALFNHDPNLILGRTVSGTLRLTVDDKGLAYEIDPPDTQTARDLIVSMERGDISQSSFGFICQEAAWGYDEVNGIDIRTIKRALLFDVSPVTFPAYVDTTSEARGLPTDMPVEVRSRLTSIGVEKRENDNGCDCSCPECVANDCEDCSDPDCTDPNCEQVRTSHRRNDNLRMAIDIALALDS